MKPFVPIQNVTEDLVVFKLFITRLISGVIVLAIAVAAMLLGGNILFAFVALISMIGLFELYRASGIEKKGPAIAGYIGALLYEMAFVGGCTGRRTDGSSSGNTADHGCLCF